MNQYNKMIRPLLLPFFLSIFSAIVSFAQTTNEKDGIEINDAPDQDIPRKSKNTNSTSKSEKKNAIGLGFGQTILLGDYRDHGDNKLGLDLFYQYQASYSFSLLTNFHATTHKQDDGQKMDLKGLVLDIKGTLFDFDSFTPYILGGLGLYWPKAKRIEGNQLIDSKEKMVFGINTGIGGDLRLNEELSFGLLGIYNYPFKSNQSNQASLKGSYAKLMFLFYYHF